MSVPWAVHPKSWRDKLYDLSLRLSGTMAQIRRPHAASASTLEQLLRIEEDLGKWRASWLAHDYPELTVRCTCLPPRPLSCICSSWPTDCPHVDMTLLQLECWSLQLLLCAPLRESTVHHDDAWGARVRARESRIASCIEATLASTPLQRTETESPYRGMTEATCRSILATWALGEYKASRTTTVNEQQAPIALGRTYMETEESIIFMEP